MKRAFFFFLLLPLALSAGEVNCKLLAQALVAMAQRDQALRQQMLQGSEGAEERVKAVDEEHMQQVKQIFDNLEAWPSLDALGEKGAEALWLLVQHAPSLDFQKRCLHYLKEAVEKREAPFRHLAYLQDRILVNEGNEQIYGTQLKRVGEHFEFYPIVDAKYANEIRQKQDWPSLEEYAKVVEDSYGMPVLFQN